MADQKQIRKNQAPQKKPAQPVAKPLNKSKLAPSKPAVLEQLDKWCEKNDSKLFYSFFVLTTLLSLLLFDSKVSTGGDDSGYIERAWFLIHDKVFPYYQG